jgi:UDP-N-acetylmuramoylalanine--D-glutamate ligase
MMDMDMSGKTAIVAGLGVSGQSMMEVLGSRAEKVLGVDEKKPDVLRFSQTFFR